MKWSLHENHVGVAFYAAGNGFAKNGRYLQGIAPILCILNRLFAGRNRKGFIGFMLFIQQLGKEDVYKKTRNHTSNAGGDGKGCLIGHHQTAYHKTDNPGEKGGDAEAGRHTICSGIWRIEDPEMSDQNAGEGGGESTQIAEPFAEIAGKAKGRGQNGNSDTDNGPAPLGDFNTDQGAHIGVSQGRGIDVVVGGGPQGQQKYQETGDQQTQGIENAGEIRGSGGNGHNNGAAFKYGGADNESKYDAADNMAGFFRIARDVRGQAGAVGPSGNNAGDTGGHGHFTGGLDSKNCAQTTIHKTGGGDEADEQQN